MRNIAHVACIELIQVGNVIHNSKQVMQAGGTQQYRPNCISAKTLNTYLGKVGKFGGASVTTSMLKILVNIRGRFRNKVKGNARC